MAALAEQQGRVAATWPSQSWNREGRVSQNPWHMRIPVLPVVGEIARVTEAENELGSKLGGVKLVLMQGVRLWPTRFPSLAVGRFVCIPRICSRGDRAECETSAGRGHHA